MPRGFVRRHVSASAMARASRSAAILVRCAGRAPRRRSRERCPLSVSRWSALSARSVKPVLGARREHAVRLGDAPRDEIVDHHAQIGFGAIEHDWRAPLARTHCGVETSDKSLGGSLFIAGRAVDLTGQEKARNTLRFQRRMELAGDRHGRTRSHSPAAQRARARAPEWRRRGRCCTSSGNEVEMPFG